MREVSGVRKAVVILSGGLDSATALGMIMAKNPRADVYPIWFGYGQHHSNQEGQAARNITDHFRIRKPRVIELPVTPCALTTGTVPRASKHAYETAVAPTFVPMRNLIMIAHAMQYAMSIHATDVVGGWHSADVGYPDCSHDFLTVMQSTMRVANADDRLRIVAPLIDFTKVDIVAAALRSRTPVHLTYSCYNGAAFQCGVCDTCAQRIDAFRTVGYADPVKYAVSIDWEGLPEFPTPAPWQD